jgi:hypothetical protein
LDCLWNAILGNKKNENIYLDNEGMYVLLEFLEECDEMHKKTALSCLSYLIENSKVKEYNLTKFFNNLMILIIRPFHTFVIGIVAKP